MTITGMILKMSEGLGRTTAIFLLTLVFSLPLGLVVAFGSMSKFRPLKWLTKGFVWIIRGTPLMLQLIIIFYTPGKLLPQNPWNNFSDGRMFACIVAFVINYACYFSVIYRGCTFSGNPFSAKRRFRSPCMST